MAVQPALRGWAKRKGYRVDDVHRLLTDAIEAELQKRALAASLTYILHGRDNGEYPDLDANSLAELVVHVQGMILDRVKRLRQAPAAPSLEVQ